MKKINFQDLPNTDTPIKASTLNTMQSNIEESCVAVSPTQPETNEKVWIDNENNIIKTKNNDGTYKTIYDESQINKTNYSTEEQVIGTWIDGKTLYSKIFVVTSPHNINTDEVVLKMPDNTLGILNIRTQIWSELANAIVQVPYYFNNNNFGFLFYNVATKEFIMNITHDSYRDSELAIYVEYTKTTD